MRYYAKYSKDNKLLAVGTGNGGTEITEKEYSRLLSEIQEKADFVNKIYNNEINIEDIPIEWKEELQRRVNERIAQQGTFDEQDISADEALDIILGGETE